MSETPLHPLGSGSGLDPERARPRPKRERERAKERDRERDRETCGPTTADMYPPPPRLCRITGVVYILTLDRRAF